ncbi:MAG TPA: site-2 protease family protein [Coriobacteriia bacterium]
MTFVEIMLTALRILLIIPAIILHEISHGYVASLLGDTTAKDAGRLTINPLAHIDLWGTIVLPGMMLLLSHGAMAFGYAKPVPINPNRMYKSGYKTGMLLTGAAGPATNIVLGCVSAVIFRVLTLFATPEIVLYIFGYFTLINMVLAFLNLIPIPPLDGSRIVQWFLKGTALQWYSELERYGFVILIALIFILPQLNQNLDLIGWYFGRTVIPVTSFLLGSGGAIFGL